MMEALASLSLVEAIQQRSCQVFWACVIIICKLLSVVASSLKTIEC